MEFDLISDYFQQPFNGLWQQHEQRWPAGFNNDCAALQLHPHERMWTSTDTLVEGVHWFSNHAAYDVGWKALACNVSDLMACGAQPVGFVLALSLPQAWQYAAQPAAQPTAQPTAQRAFLSEFSVGLLACAHYYQCPLVGGDTTAAPAASHAVVITITVFGVAPQDHAGFPRQAAAVGEGIWVSGLPGLARLGLLCEYQQRGTLLQYVPSALDHLALLQALPQRVREDALLALHRPKPPVPLGLALRGQASAALDLSDGLAGDLVHIAKASQCQLVLDASALLGLWQRDYPAWFDGLSISEQDLLLECSLVGGDDYALCWTQCDAAVIPLAQSIYTLTARVGFVQAGCGLCLLQPSGLTAMPCGSYQHFSQACIDYP